MRLTRQRLESMPMRETASRTTRRTSPEGLRLGERLRQLRVAAGLTQTDVAGDRFSKEYISQIERGKTRPTQETIEWLHFLLRFDPTKRLLVIGTARPEEMLAGQPVAQWLVQLRSDGSVIELALDPLDAAETNQLAMQVTKRELDDESALLLYRASEGNPLFVMEMATADLSAAYSERTSADSASVAPISPSSSAAFRATYQRLSLSIWTSVDTPRRSCTIASNRMRRSFASSA